MHGINLGSYRTLLANHTSSKVESSEMLDCASRIDTLAAFEFLQTAILSKIFVTEIKVAKHISHCDLR